MWDWLSSALAANPVLLLFTVAALGYPLGRIKVFGVSMGVSMVLFAALGIGALDQRFRLPELTIQIGLVLFIYTIGLASGATFFASLRKRGLPAVALALCGLALAVALTLTAAKLMSLPAPTAAGGFTGAVTNTAALAAVLHSLKESDQGAAIVGYSIAYPMGVLGLILVQLAAIKLIRQEKSETAKPALSSRTIMVTRPEAEGLSIAKVKEGGKSGVIFGRIKKGDEVFLVESDTTLSVGDLVTAVGTEEDLGAVEAALGGPAPEDLTLDRTHFDYRRMFVSNRDIVGIPLRQLGIPHRVGAIITRIRRGDTEFIPHAGTTLQPGDRVRVVADSRRLAEVSRFFGDSYSQLSEIDIMSFSLGIAMGALLGLAPIPLPGGITVSLGLAGGPLLVSLALGALHRTGPIVWEMPYSANLTLRQLGLILFFSGVGTRAGYDFWQTLWTPLGLQLFAAFALVTCLTATGFLFLAVKALKISLPTALGMAAGLHTQPAALAFASENTKSDQPGLGYAMVFPVASISKIILAQVILSLLSS